MTFTSNIQAFMWYFSLMRSFSIIPILSRVQLNHERHPLLETGRINEKYSTNASIFLVNAILCSESYDLIFTIQTRTYIQCMMPGGAGGGASDGAERG